MLGNIKSNKTVWLIAGLLICITVAVFMAIKFIAPKSATTPSREIAPPPIQQNTKQQTATQQPLSDEQLIEIAQASIDSEQEEFAGLVDETLIKQPIPDDPALIKDELEQLKDIQSQLDEQKSTLEQQHKDADQLLELKEQQLKALEQQLAS